MKMGEMKSLKKLLSMFIKKIPGKQAELISEFARQFYGNVSFEDLCQHSILDLYGAILSHWELMKQRPPGEPKIRIFNPHFEQHGWQSTHTIIEIAHDDMPFLVDSLRMEINRQGFTMHLIIHYGGLKVRRDKKGIITEVLPFNSSVGESIVAEAPIYIEIDRQTQPEVLDNLKQHLDEILTDVHATVEDWSKMRNNVRDALAYIEKTKPPLDPDDIAEAKDFLRWLENDHFTLLD